MEDEMKLMPMFNNECEVSQSTITCSAYDIYLDEDIKAPTYYRKAFHVLRSAQPGDLVRIYISSHGGNLNSALIFKNCIENCEADVVAIIEAEAYSAASLIALSAPNIEVKPYATMMLHSASFGSGGPVQNVRDHVEFTGRHAESLMEEVYRDFISEEELLDLKKGRELWFNYEEIGERLDKMFRSRDSGCQCGECELDAIQGEIQEFDLSTMIEESVSAAVTKALDNLHKKYDIAPKPKPVKQPRKKKVASKEVTTKEVVDKGVEGE